METYQYQNNRKEKGLSEATKYTNQCIDQIKSFDYKVNMINYVINYSNHKESTVIPNLMKV